jgi:hypothetical protein
MGSCLWFVTTTAGEGNVNWVGTVQDIDDNKSYNYLLGITKAAPLGSACRTNIPAHLSYGWP